MGILDSIKNAFGTKAGSDHDTSPERVLRDAGIDPGGLQFSFEAGVLTVTGEVPDEAELQKVMETLGGAPGIPAVEHRLIVVAASPAAAAAEPSQGVRKEAKSYTVKSGDTLWQIAREVYGDGSKYMEIFEANTDVLEQPDQIRPGQELRIPQPDD